MTSQQTGPRRSCNTRWFTLHCFFSLFLYLCLCVMSAPTTQRALSIINAAGVAISADGAQAFVSSIDYFDPSVYVIPLPFNASTDSLISPFWTGNGTMQFYFIAASSSNRPQWVYLLDDLNAQLLALAVGGPMNATTILLYNFGIANQILINGMFHQQSSDLLFFSCVDHFGGSAFDFVGWLEPTSPFPVLQTLYVTSYFADLAGLAVSSTHLYFGRITTVFDNNVAELWAVPLTSSGPTSLIPNTTEPQLLYTTLDSVLSTLTIGDLVDPAALLLNADESILYITDIGNQDAEQAITPHAIYALYPLYGSNTPLNLSIVYGYEGPNTEIQSSFALSPDQSALYFAATGYRQGLYIVTHPNSSIALPAPASQPTGSPTVSVSSSLAQTSPSLRGISSSLITVPSSTPSLATLTSSSSPGFSVSSDLTASSSSGGLGDWTTMSTPTVAMTWTLASSTAVSSIDSSSLGKGGISGIVVGAVASFLILLCLLGWFHRKRSRQGNERKQQDSEFSGDSVVSVQLEKLEGKRPHQESL